MKQFLLLFVLLSFGLAANAQDKIFTRSGETIECKVVEVGIEEVKYKLSTDEDAAIISIKKIDVLRIEFANGKVEEYRDELEDPNLYTDNNKTAWKMDFLSPVMGHLGLYYERSMKPGFSLEGGLGLIGVGYKNVLDDSNPWGAYVRFGPRFMKTPDYRKSSLRYYHVLKGAYLQPQVVFGAFSSDISYSTFNTGTWVTGYVTSRQTTTYGSFLLTVGKQSVFSNRFLVDFYLGVGYGFRNTTRNNIPDNADEIYFSSRTFGALVGGQNGGLPLSATAGIKLGFLTK